MVSTDTLARRIDSRVSADNSAVILSGKAKPSDLPDLIEGAVTAKL